MSIYQIISYRRCFHQEYNILSFGVKSFLSVLFTRVIRSSWTNGKLLNLLTFRNESELQLIEYSIHGCQHLIHVGFENGTVAALSDCHQGKLIRGFVSTPDIDFDIIKATPHFDLKETEDGSTAVEVQKVINHQFKALSFIDMPQNITNSHYKTEENAFTTREKQF